MVVKKIVKENQVKNKMTIKKITPTFT